ncbi:hypothetical protein vseg_021004 [Gypsophila vaccaria]
MLTSTRLLNISGTPVPDQAIIPAHAAVPFPTFKVRNFDDKLINLPVESNGGPMARLLCLSLHTCSQDMIHTWSDPFHRTFNNYSSIHIYEVLFKDSYSFDFMRKKWLNEQRKKQRTYSPGALHKQCLFSFGGRSDIQKRVKILNAMIGYLFLLDNYGRVRWQGSGEATREGLGSLVSCTNQLLY